MTFYKDLRAREQERGEKVTTNSAPSSWLDHEFMITEATAKQKNNAAEGMRQI